ncbi:MAG: hypothetical protein HZA92_02430 [Verrucomicrobia bacterium]|nr:hypothetical protein [Verrucomicrobiota bacterium]
MGLLNLLKTGKSLVGLTNKLVTQVPLGEVVPNFHTRLPRGPRTEQVGRGRKREAFAAEGKPAVRAGGPKIRSTVSPDPKLPKNPFVKPSVKRRRPKTDESLQVQPEAQAIPVLALNFVPPSAGKSWATRLRSVRDKVKSPIARKLKVPARLAKAFGEQAAAVRRRVPRGPLAARPLSAA